MDVKTLSVHQQDLVNDFILNIIIGEASDGRANGCSLGNRRRRYVLVQVTTDSDKLCKYLCIDTYIAK